MAGEQSYVRVPPDSTGKKIRHQPFIRAGFNKTVSDHIWKLGGIYTISGSVTMTVTVFKGPAVGFQTGYIGINPSEQDVFSATIPSNGDVISYEGTPVATLTSAEYLHIPYTHISGGDSPHNTVNVDNTGSLNVRFHEGNPQLDAFGKLRNSQSEIIGDYTFAVDTLPTQFTPIKIGNGANISYNDTMGAGITLEIDNDATNYNTYGVSHYGIAKTTSNTWHHYVPGFSQLFMSTVVVDNPNVVNGRYQWGYGGRKNGVFFRVQEGIISAVVISSTTGSVVETVIPSSDWNHDKLDGTGDSQMVLDVTKDNIYWIDMQWLGAGTVRFGVFHNGERITCHADNNDNTAPEPYMNSGSMPVEFSVTAVNGPVPSVASMKAFCAGVYSEGKSSRDVYSATSTWSLHTLFTTAQLLSPTNPGGYQYIGSMAPTITHAHIVGQTRHNRSMYFTDEIEALVMSYTAGTQTYAGPTIGEVEIYFDCVLGGTTWAEAKDALDTRETHVEYEESATYYGGGTHALIKYIKENGHGIYDLTDTYVSQSHGAFKNYSNHGGNAIQNIISLTPGATTSIQVADGIHTFREWSEDLVINGTGTTADGQTVYLHITGIDTADLYTDEARTVPLNTAGDTWNTSGTIEGFRGTRFVMTALWKPFIDKDKDQDVRFKIQWKEVIQ